MKFVDFLPIVLSAIFQGINGLSFKQEPTGTGYYKRRDIVKLFCQVDSPSVEVVWYLNGSPLQHSSKTSRAFSKRDASDPSRAVHTDYIIERITNGSSLVFAPFRPQANAGIYHCSATETDTGVTILSKSVILKKPVGPKQEFEEYMKSVEALAGNNVVLNCTQPVHAEPAIYKWRYRKSQILEEFKDIDGDYSELPFGKFVTTPNGNLYLYNVSTQFAGDYRCVTVNELLEREAVTSYYYRLFVRTPKSLRNPVISHFPWYSQTQLEKGQSLTLECNADGAPRPTVAWRFSSFLSSSQHVGRSLQYKHKLHTQHEGIFTLNNASMEDSGIYACELEPAGSELIKTVNVTVVPPLDVQIFTHGDEEDGNLTSSMNFTVGTTSTLRCSANRPINSNPHMKILWLRNGQILSEEAMGVHQEVYASGANLVISNAQLGDSGVYQCFLAEEHASKSSNQLQAGGGINSAFRSPFGALVGNSNSADYYQPAASSNGLNNNNNNVLQQPLLVYNLHADVSISVSWPQTTLEATTRQTTREESSSTPLTPSDESLVEPPVVIRVEKLSTPVGSVEVYWDFKLPSSLRDGATAFLVERCKLPCRGGNGDWQLGAMINSTQQRSAVVSLLPQQLNGLSASSYIFRVVAKFRAPFFAATSGLLQGNATIQPTNIEPVIPPSDLKAMAIGPDRIAAVWSDSQHLESLAPDVRDKLWYEVQWRPLGSNNGDTSNVYEVQHFSVRKPVSSIKNAPQKISPFVVLVDLSPSTFYEIRVRYIRMHDQVGQVDALSSWSSLVHAETAMYDAPPMLDSQSMTQDALGVAISSLFFPKMFDKSSTQISTRSNENPFFGASSDLLYTVLGILMGCLVITLVVFVVLCALRQKRQRKYIQNMRRQLNRLPSKENLNRLLTPSQLAQQQQQQKNRPTFSAASPQGTSLSHHQQALLSTDESIIVPNGHARFNMPPNQHFQQQLGIFSGSALSSPTAVSAALAADISDNILISDHHRNGGFGLQADRPKLSMANKGNAYGTMQRGTKHLNGTAAQLQSPHVAHNPYYRTLDSHRLFSNGGAANKFSLSNGASKSGTPYHVADQQQPLLSAESAFVEPPYELPSSVLAAQQQQRLILANQHALAGLGGPPLSAAAASVPANSVAQHYSTYSTFGRKNPLNNNAFSTRLNGANAPTNNNPNIFYNDGSDCVALAEMGVTANGIFISNGGAVDSSNRSGAGLPASIKSSSTSPSATVALQLGSIGYSANVNHANLQPAASGSINGGGGPQSSSVSGSDQNGEGSDGNIDSTGSIGLAQRYGNRNANNMSLGAAYRPPPQLSFLT